MKYMDIDCYERGCACASSNQVAGENSEVVEVVKYRELTDEEIMEVLEQIESTYDPYEIETSYDYEMRIAKAILERAKK